MKGFSHSWGDLHQTVLVSGEELNVNHVTLSVIWAYKYERLFCSVLNACWSCISFQLQIRFRMYCRPQINQHCWYRQPVKQMIWHVVLFKFGNSVTFSCSGTSQSIIHEMWVWRLCKQLTDLLCAPLSRCDHPKVLMDRRWPNNKLHQLMSPLISSCLDTKSIIKCDYHPLHIQSEVFKCSGCCCVFWTVKFNIHQTQRSEKEIVSRLSVNSGGLT